MREDGPPGVWRTAAFIVFGREEKEEEGEVEDDILFLVLCFGFGFGFCCGVVGMEVNWVRLSVLFV